MKEQLIEFETAKLAKEKGFDWQTLKAYDGVPMVCSHSESVFKPLNYNSESGGNYYSAPTQSLLQKWLREEYNLWVEITLWGDGIGSQCMIKESHPDDMGGDGSRVVRSIKVVEVALHTRLEFNYEKILELGLIESLKFIK